MHAPYASRDAWRSRRLEMEAGGDRFGPEGPHSRYRWKLLKLAVALFGLGLKLIGLYRRGVRNALDIRLTRLDLVFPDLPEAFDGFTILHLTDLHVDGLPGTMEAARAHAAAQDVDLCVLTGDYRFRVQGPFEQILPGMTDLVAAVRARHGIVGILGNHDDAAMVDEFERLGINMLVNESRTIERAGDAIHLTGTDDVHYFYTGEAPAALSVAPRGFRIALIHSPELADVAAAEGFRLYLAGHTHGGQVCLPGGTPVLTHVGRFRSLARGHWRLGDMQGYTSTGVGTSALPVRFNNRGEVALITLRRAGG